MAAAAAQKRYISLEVPDSHPKFMGDGLSDPVRFARVARDLIAEAAKAARASVPTLQLVENAHLPCGHKVKGMLRLSWKDSGTS